MTVSILITLPVDRTQPGTLTVSNDQTGVTKTFGCLGKADEGMAESHINPTRDPTKPFGDTPLGNYLPAAIVNIGNSVPHMGNIIIPLTGTDGQALEANLNGRSGLAIHGGRGNGGGPYSGYWPSDGCCRLFDEDMQALATIMNGEKATISIVQSTP